MSSWLILKMGTVLRSLVLSKYTSNVYLFTKMHSSISRLYRLAIEISTSSHVPQKSREFKSGNGVGQAMRLSRSICVDSIFRTWIVVKEKGDLERVARWLLYYAYDELLLVNILSTCITISSISTAKIAKKRNAPINRKVVKLLLNVRLHIRRQWLWEEIPWDTLDNQPEYKQILNTKRIVSK